MRLLADQGRLCTGRRSKDLFRYVPKLRHNLSRQVGRTKDVYMPRGLKKACLGAWLVFTKAFLRMVSRWMTPVFCQRNKNRLDKPRDETEAWLYSLEHLHKPMRPHKA